jgi:hypothetical protein
MKGIRSAEVGPSFRPWFQRGQAQGGRKEGSANAGDVMYFDAVEHLAENLGGQAFEVIAIELKKRSGSIGFCRQSRCPSGSSAGYARAPWNRLVGPDSTNRLTGKWSRRAEECVWS